MEKLSIVKIGGAVLEAADSFRDFMLEFSKISGNKILVHGGGRTATQIAEKLGIISRIIDGRRITDEGMMEVVTMVYGGLINKKSVAFLQSLGCNAIGLAGADLDLIRAVRRPVGEIDYGLVGDISKVNSAALRMLLTQNMVPVIAPLTYDGNGNLLNTNADTIASEVAAALSDTFQVSLIYCFEKEGVMLDVNDETSLIKAMNKKLFEQYRIEGIIHSGMLPKLENCFKALEAGVNEVIITNSKLIQTKSGTRLTL